MTTISCLKDCTRFLPGPLMPALVHFQSIPQYCVFSKCKAAHMYVCVPSAALTCTQTSDSAVASHSPGDNVQRPRRVSHGPVSLLLPPLPLRSHPPISCLWSHWPLFNHTCLPQSLPPPGLSPRRAPCLEHSLPSGVSPRGSLLWAVFPEAHTLTRSSPGRRSSCTIQDFPSTVLSGMHFYTVCGLFVNIFLLD